MNDLKELLRGNVASPPPEPFDSAGLVTAGRRRVRRRRMVMTGSALAVTLAVATPLGLGLRGDDVAHDPGYADPPPATSFQVRQVVASTADKTGKPEEQQLEAYSCPTSPTVAPADEQATACDAQGEKFLLEPAAIDGGVVSAEPMKGPLGAWLVTVQLDDTATAAMTELTKELVGSPTMIALVVDGVVLSAPTIAAVISSGQLQLSGGNTTTKAEAIELANGLVDAD